MGDILYHDRFSVNLAELTSVLSYFSFFCFFMLLLKLLLFFISKVKFKSVNLIFLFLEFFFNGPLLIYY